MGAAVAQRARPPCDRERRYASRQWSTSARKPPMHERRLATAQAPDRRRRPADRLGRATHHDGRHQPKDHFPRRLSSHELGTSAPSWLGDTIRDASWRTAASFARHNTSHPIPPAGPLTPACRQRGHEVVAAASRVRHAGEEAITRPGLDTVGRRRRSGFIDALGVCGGRGMFGPAVRRSVCRTREVQPIAKRRLRSRTAPHILGRARAESMPPALLHASETRRFPRARSPRRSGVPRGPRHDRSTSEVHPKDPMRACHATREDAPPRSDDRLDPICRRGEAPRSPRPTGSSRSRGRPNPSQRAYPSRPLGRVARPSREREVRFLAMMRAFAKNEASIRDTRFGLGEVPTSS